MAMSRREFARTSAAGLVLLGIGARPAEADRLPRNQVRALRDAVRGRVLTPGNSGYNVAREVFNRRYAGVRPPAVVQVRDRADVQAVVRWAERFDVPLTARSGGHAYNGASTSRSAVVVDLRRLDGVRLQDGIATIGPGARLIDVYASLAGRGATIPAGSCPTVRIGGLATGGGMGLAGRALGLTLDRVRGISVVTADGELRRVSGDDDLFWALRGGGGSFGLVTSFSVRARNVRRAAFFRVTYPASSRAEALAAWDALAPGAPDDLTAIFTLTSSSASAFGQFLGSEAELRRIVRPLGRVPGASVSTGTSGYLALQRRWAGCSDGGCHDFEPSAFVGSSIYVARQLSSAARRAFLDATEEGVSLILDAYGGAISSVAPDATAFVHRDVRFCVQILSYAPIPTARSRVRRARGRIAAYGNGGAYQNYADPDLDGALRAYYGSNLGRLRQIKTAVDPADRFRPAQGIRPS
jgi:FAD/FMN-containing dehydrogenase